MIRPGMVWGVARAESRLCRRLVRYWVFQSLAAAVGIALYLYYFFLHYQLSSYSATAAMLNPRYLISVVGIYYIVQQSKVYLLYALSIRFTEHPVPFQAIYDWIYPRAYDIVVEHAPREAFVVDVVALTFEKTTTKPDSIKVS